MRWHPSSIDKSSSLDRAMDGARNTHIRRYFNQGYSYALILCFLKCAHGINLSLRQLKRILKLMGLKRYQPPLTVARRQFLRGILLVRSDTVKARDVIGTVFTQLEAGASISFQYFVDQASNQGRLFFITLLFCTLLKKGRIINGSLKPKGYQVNLML